MRPLRPLSKLLLLLCLLLPLTACTAGSEAPPVTETPEATATPRPVRGTISFEYDRGIDVSDQLLVRNVANDARRFYERSFDRPLSQDVTIELSARAGNVFQGYAFTRNVRIFTGDDGWPKGDDPYAIETKASLVAHELFHNFQWVYAYTDDAIPGRTPWWLTEGSAEYAAKRWASFYFEVDWEDYRGYYEEVAADTSRRLDSNTKGTTFEEYAKAFLAVDELMADQPLKLLGDYFHASGSMDWDDAFVKVFDRDPYEFIAQFEDARD